MTFSSVRHDFRKEVTPAGLDSYILLNSVPLTTFYHSFFHCSHFFPFSHKHLLLLPFSLVHPPHLQILVNGLSSLFPLIFYSRSLSHFSCNITVPYQDDNILIFLNEDPPYLLYPQLC
jgi:hypothetical protein